MWGFKKKKVQLKKLIVKKKIRYKSPLFGGPILDYFRKKKTKQKTFESVKRKEKEDKKS